MRAPAARRIAPRTASHTASTASRAALRPASRSVEVVVDGVSARVRPERLTRFCSRALRAAGFTTWEVAVLLCGDRRIRELNRRFRGKPDPTDVLSFPREEGRKGEPVCGDIAVSLDTLGRNALRFGTSENEEMKRLLVHGLLHLAGMDHGRGKSGKMLALQEELLLQLQPDMIYGVGGRRK
jgi:probable rRNA maturation factor